MNKIEAVILDLDGTLLDDNKNIDEKAKEIVKEIKDDIKVVIASARQFCEIKTYLKSLDLIDDTNYTICFNGAQIVTNNNDEIFSSTIGEGLIHSIDDFILNNSNIKWVYYTNENQFARDEIKDIKDFTSQNNIFT